MTASGKGFVMSGEKRQKVMLIALAAIAAVAAGAWWIGRGSGAGKRATTQTNTQGRRTREVQESDRKKRAKPRRREQILDQPEERKQREVGDRDTGERKKKRRSSGRKTKKKKITPAAYIAPEVDWIPSDPFEPLEKPMFFA